MRARRSPLGSTCASSRRRNSTPLTVRHSLLRVLGVAVAEGDLACVAGEDVLLLDDAPVEVTAEIDERLRTGAHRPAVDDPLGRHAAWDREAGGREGGEHPGAKHPGQGLMGEQIARLAAAAFGAPKPALTVDGPGGHDRMDMGVVIQPAGMGVQYRHGPRNALKRLVVQAEGLQGLPAHLHQEVIDGALMGEREGAQLGGQGEGEQVILARDQFSCLALDPLLGFVGLAVRAAAMAAGMRDEDLLVAFRAGGLHAGGQAGPALPQGRERLELAWEHLVAILGQKGLLEGLDEGG